MSIPADSHLSYIAEATLPESLVSAIRIRPGADIFATSVELAAAFVMQFGPIAWAIARFAPEWASRADATTLLIAEEKGSLARDRGAWLSVLGRMLRGSGPLTLDLCTRRALNLSTKGFKPILAVKRPKILSRSLPEILRDESLRPYDGLVPSARG